MPLPPHEQIARKASGPVPVPPLDEDLARAFGIVNRRFELEIFDRTQRHALRFDERERRTHEIAREPRTDRSG